MPGDWSRLEVEATVADYLAMLQLELRGEAFNKADRRRRLQPLLNNRSEQSIEFKRANISAVLIELGFPFVGGYKPRYNYQALLAEVVAEQIAGADQLVRTVAADADAAVVVPEFADILAALTEPPASRGARTTQLRERRRAPGDFVLPRPAVNYLERESRNRLLGEAGELFVLRFEEARLVAANQERLAAKIEHVSRVRGDGAGYDILSFEDDGREKLIEVKTTKHGRETPFFVSRNEMHVSSAEAERYHLYRCFNFRQRPALFTLAGSLQATCVLEPTTYEASVA